MVCRSESICESVTSGHGLCGAQMIVALGTEVATELVREPFGNEVT
jgi:hypothetical protein